MSKAVSRYNGVLVVDKPPDITSFGVVKQVRRTLGVNKAGHTGTLDPLATGVLPICLGEATKIASLLLAEDKAYEATALLGLQTDTLDVTGEVLSQQDPSGVRRSGVEAQLARMRGIQQQVPPAFSAIHQGGRRAYELARKGEEVVLSPRKIEVQKLELSSWDPPRVGLSIQCSKGTYVRSLVDDLGRALGPGAALEALRRVKSGSFSLSQSVPLCQVEARAQQGDLPLVSMDQALAHLPGVDIGPQDLERIRHGQPLETQGPPPEGLVRIRHQQDLVALGREKEGRLWPKRVFNVGVHS